jgi:hypothetical protein
MAIQSTAIGTGNTDLYVSNGNTAVTCIWVCNTVTYNPVDPTSNLTYLDLHFVKQGAGITATNLIVSQLAVPAGETVTFDTEKIILDNGDRVVASSAAPANLVATVSSISV